jgi:hypothetical protein
MGRFRPVLLVFLASATIAAAADPRDPLARARTLYNGGQYEAAIAAADQARLVVAQADRADLIAARSYLERFRESRAADDLDNARTRLKQIDPQRFGAPERVEFLVGLGETLYFDGAFGAAGDVFGTLLTRADDLPVAGRDRVLDWWASAIDRDSRTRVEIDRQAPYQRVRDRMLQEIAVRPGSTAASYWLAAAARGQSADAAGHRPRAREGARRAARRAAAAVGAVQGAVDALSAARGSPRRTLRFFRV